MMGAKGYNAWQELMRGEALRSIAFSTQPAHPMDGLLSYNPRHILSPEQIESDQCYVDNTQRYYGAYAENRPGIYQNQSARYFHCGLDIVAKPGESVFSVETSEVVSFGYNESPLDYGGVVILKACDFNLWYIYGHLDPKSFSGLKKSDVLSKGRKFAEIGNESVNGGWRPHLHFQLSLLPPLDGDIPGAVTIGDIVWGLKVFPNPVEYLKLKT